MSSNKLWEWFTLASSAERKRLATLCKSSVTSIRFAAKAYRSDGVPATTAEFAARIEQGVKEVNSDSGTLLPEVRREDLCQTCRECPYQIKCNRKDD